MNSLTTKSDENDDEKYYNEPKFEYLLQKSISYFQIDSSYIKLQYVF